MLAYPPDSQQFQTDQVPIYRIEYWDTPFTALTNDIASGGIIFTMREPVRGGDWATFAANVRDTDASAVLDAFHDDTTNAQTRVDAGRLANLSGFWAGGAPGHHGATVAGAVAYHFECYVRSTEAREWFAPTTNFSAVFFAAGNGNLRIVHNGVDVINTTMDEQLWIDEDNGGPVMSDPVTLATDDRIDIYYVQNQTTWGGFVFKILPTPSPVPTTLRERLLAIRDAAVIGCGIMDGGDSLEDAYTKKVLTMTDEVSVTMALGQTTGVTFRVPLVDPDVDDGIGWQWVRDDGDAAGYLEMHDFEPDGDGVAEVVQTVKRQRLVRIWGGFRRWDGDEEIYPLFTGFIDDFSEASSGRCLVRCLSLEQRLADQFVKNYPDKISYMTYGYYRLFGTSQPVWAIPAFDNWPLEYALRELLVRAGVDEGRTRAPFFVPQADGSSIAVVM